MKTSEARKFPWAIVRGRIPEGLLVGRALPYGAYAISFSVLLLAWQAIPTYLVNPAFFATPGQTLDAAVTLVNRGTLQENIAVTTTRILLGLSVGSILGVIVGLAMGSVVWLRTMLEPHLNFFRFVPSLALIPLAILWFGIGESQKIVLILWTTTFIVVINTIAGVVVVPEYSVRAARSLGASPFQVFVHVTIPYVVPYAVAGVKLAMVNGFGTVIVAEMVAAESGLGYMIVVSTFALRPDIMFVGIVTLGVLGFCSDRIFRLVALTVTSKYGTKL
jgi:ABC-type nitrate/sulfonate/bicarbonate transport system permease component